MARVGKYKRTQLEERARIIYLWQNGCTFSEIAALTGSSPTTTRRWVRRWQAEGNIFSREKLKSLLLNSLKAGPNITRRMLAGSLLGMTYFTLSCCEAFQIYDTLASHSPVESEAASGATQAINVILQEVEDSFIIFIRGQNSLIHNVGELRAPLGIAVFSVMLDSQEDNVTQHVQLSQIVSQARQLQRMSWSVMVVVVSDDPAFLASFTQRSLEGRLLVWSTRLLFLTRLTLHHLHHLHNTLVTSNSVLLHLACTQPLKWNVYVALPYTHYQTQLHRAASWNSQRGLTVISALFPSKFHRFQDSPRLLVAHVNPPDYVRMVDDPNAPGGERVIVQNPMVTVLETVAQDMKFSFSFVEPPDRTWGLRLKNGSWTGMIGQVQRQEVDMSVGFFGITASRAEVVDFTYPVTFMYALILSARGSPEVNSWGFLLPLTPSVWGTVLISLLVVLTVMMAIASCLPLMTPGLSSLTDNIASCVRVLLQQDVKVVREWWWCERMVLGLWMLTTVVLTRSYAGNLMSLLAVRYIPMPIQSLQDIIDNPVTLLLQRGSLQAQAFMAAESGVLAEVGALQHLGRLQTITTPQLVTAMDSLVRRGDHVIISLDITKRMMAQDFSLKGKCDFYLARDQLLPYMFAMVGPKGSPLVLAISSRIVRVVEGGLYDHWHKMSTPNYTSCFNPATKVATRTPLSLNNIWGMLVVLAGGGIVSLLVFCFEQIFCCFQRGG